MNTAVKAGIFAGGLAVVFGGAYGVGGVIGPEDAGAEPAAHGEHAGEEETATGHGGHAEAGEVPGGLQVSEGGYTLDLRTSRLRADRESELAFTILDAHGKPVTAYEEEHEKELHLILAARDLSTFRHVHPVRAADGTWSIDVNLPTAGDYRVFADFKPAAKGAKALTLGADLAVAGAYNPAKLPEPDTTATVDGYTVTLDGGLAAGAGRDLKFHVEKSGRPVTDLQPYLGAYGHLVALRTGDLAYLHVHPNGEPGDGATKPGPEVSFAATAPSDGTYRLYLDFKHEGEVRTAAFTVRTGTAPQAGDSHDDAGHSH
ncbi:hypothetical protein SRB5_33370 [Streptomyces sp. RB5]|uniref:Secreted protein n=1 Tax=Streptomyces smaragdinus TaxID=2585196 RepID=A0A7K0CK92_9ACTN|nr:hypothetical protein [Streptomyces smaragdinus]MQY13194.1 hypothetical protein [Streptomyces smaragdinus]